MLKALVTLISCPQSFLPKGCFLLLKDHAKNLVSFTQFLSFPLVSYKSIFYRTNSEELFSSLNEMHIDINRNSVDFLMYKDLMERT